MNSAPQNSTVPVSNDVAALPPGASLSPLAKAALEAGCSPSDVHAYVAGRPVASGCTECGQDTDGTELCDGCHMHRFGLRPAGTFRVRYFSAKHSRKGAGVRVAEFDVLDAAEKFAAANQLYARPCKVETVAL